MGTERIDVVVSESGSRTVKRNLEDIGAGATSAESAVTLLKRALATIGVVELVRQIAALTSAWVELKSRIDLTTQSQNQTAAVMDRLQLIAQRTYAPLQQIGDIYLENRDALKSLGYTTQQQLDFTEAMTNALVVSAAKGDRAAAVINALSDSMLKGKVSGLQWQTILTEGGRVVTALADYTGKSIKQLREMASEGTLDSKTIFLALTSQLKELRKEADSMPATIGDAVTLFGNRLLEVVGKFDQVGGFTTIVVKGIDLISSHLEPLIKIILAVAAGFAIWLGVPAIIEGVTAAVKLLTAAIIDNPIGIIVFAVTTAVTALTLFRDQIKLGTDDITTLGDVFRVIGSRLADFWTGLVSAAQTAFQQMKSLWDAFTKDTDQQVKQSTDSLSQDYADFYSGVGTGVAGAIRAVARTIDAIAGLLTGAILTVTRAVGGLPDVFENIFKAIYNSVVKIVQDMVNAWIDSLNKLRSLVGKDQIAHVAFSMADVDKDAVKNYAENIANSFRDGFQIQGGFMENWVNGLFTDAQKVAKDRVAAEKAKGGSSSLTGGGGPGEGTGMSEKDRKRLLDQLQNLIGSYDGVARAQFELAADTKILNEAEKAGLITYQQKSAILAKIKQQLQDQLDPIGAVNRQLDQQVKLAKMTADQQQVENQLEQIRQTLEQSGQTVDRKQLDTWRQKLELIQKLNQQQQIQNQLIQNSAAGQQQTFGDQVQGMKSLLNNPASGYTKTDAFNEANQALGGLFDSSQQAIDAQIAAQQQVLDKVNQLRQADIISEQTASQARREIWAQEQAIKLQQASNLMGSLAQLASSSNKKLAAIGKAAAITQAIINTYEGATKALAQGGLYGIAMAAIVVAAGLAQVAQIRNQQLAGYAFGGDFTVGGTGGTDSQLVAFRATPGERVAVTTPTQDRNRSQSGGGNGGARITNINVLDPALVGQYLSTSEGNDVFINRIQANVSVIRDAVKEA